LIRRRLLAQAIFYVTDAISPEAEWYLHTDLRQPLALEHSGDLYSCDHFVSQSFFWEASSNSIWYNSPILISSGNSEMMNLLLQEVEMPGCNGDSG